MEKALKQRDIDLLKAEDAELNRKLNANKYELDQEIINKHYIMEIIQEAYPKENVLFFSKCDKPSCNCHKPQA